MVKICICDIDGVVADSIERFKRAEQARNEKQAELDKEPYVSGDREEAKRKIPTDLYWSVALSPDLIPLDTLIEGAKDALKTLRHTHNYEILFMTSRPEALREATRLWLFGHNILPYTSIAGQSVASLTMKAPAFQYTKTTAWKVGMIQTLARLYGASEVLVIEDEQANRQAILDGWTKDVALLLCPSLKQAIGG